MTNKAPKLATVPLIVALSGISAEALANEPDAQQETAVREPDWRSKEEACSSVRDIVRWRIANTIHGFMVNTLEDDAVTEANGVKRACLKMNARDRRRHYAWLFRQSGKRGK